MEIRAATEGDIDAIRRIARDAWEAAYLDIIGQKEVDAAMDEWYSDEHVSGALAREEIGYFVAVDERSSSARRMESDDADEDGEVVGFASGGPTDEVGVGALTSIYVHPDRWGEGIGERLLDAVERHLDEQGSVRIRAFAMADNEVGNDFYRSQGFERVEEREADLFAGKTVEENVYYREIE